VHFKGVYVLEGTAKKISKFGNKFTLHIAKQEGDTFAQKKAKH